MNPGKYWQSLPYESWSDTLDALHMKMQVIGKVKLALCPFLNQWWQVAFYLNTRGMHTGVIPYEDGFFDIEFDFIDHYLAVRTSNNKVKVVPFIASSVATFYNEFIEIIRSLGIYVSINSLPCEFSDPVPFEMDHAKNSYNKEYVHTWWKILLQVQGVFESFRSGFRGKSSPVHFFWGSFDLCETRFSGKPCQPPLGGGRIMKYAENEENFTFGFWPGDKNFPRPAFYSYFYPSIVDIETFRYYNNQMKEFILDYQEVIDSDTPEELILDFLNETYERGAKAAGWDIESLISEIPLSHKVYG